MLLVRSDKEERDLERFFPNVEFTSYCWNWKGRTNDEGYGEFDADGKYLAHRWLYDKIREKLPPFEYGGPELDHLCRNHGCVRPSHLELVTHLENCLRGSKSKATHCKHGHEYTSENTITKNRKGRIHRDCRTCERQRARRQYATDEVFRARRLAESHARYDAKKRSSSEG